MERDLKLRVIDQDLKYQKYYVFRKIICVIGFGALGISVFLIAGFFLLQIFVQSRITHYSGSNMFDSDAKIEVCNKDFNVSSLGEEFNSLSFYQMGWDNEGVPVWTLHIGKLDMRRILETDESNAQKTDAIGTYAAEQLMCSIIKTERRLSRKAWVIIINFDGYSLSQFTTYAVVDNVFQFLSKILQLLDHVAYGYFINLNFVGYSLLKILSPVLGKNMERVLVESDPQVWMPVIKSMIPIRFLPPELGGFANYTCPTEFCSFYRGH